MRRMPAGDLRVLLPKVRIIGSTLDGEIELMTIGEIYPSPSGPGNKGIGPRKF